MTTTRIAPPAFLHDPALQAVLAALPSARLVGGCVRDAVVGVPAVDIDLATPLAPDAVMQALAQAGLKAVPTGFAHGTVTAVSGGSGFEVTTLRRDISTDGRHAQVAFTDDWAMDAARRDFTFNALSMTPDGEVHDHFGGMADLSEKRVRFVGDPALRVAEDRLRVLRYFRFYARYGSVPPDQATRAALSAAAPDLHLLSVERVWNELQRILSAPAPLVALHLMRALGVLDAVLPEAGGLATLQAMQAAGAPPDPLLRLAALVDGDPAVIASRLRMSTTQSALLAEYWHAPAIPQAATDDDLRRLLCDHSPLALEYAVWRYGGSADLRARIGGMHVPRFPLHGRDVVAAGVPAGPAIGALVRQMEARWRAGGCRADRAECLRWLADAVRRP